eukprot:2084783-Alexandrium_andersonii.AAC.1
MFSAHMPPDVTSRTQVSHLFGHRSRGLPRLQNCPEPALAQHAPVCVALPHCCLVIRYLVGQCARMDSRSR